MAGTLPPANPSVMVWYCPSTHRRKRRKGSKQPSAKKGENSESKKKEKILKQFLISSLPLCPRATAGPTMSEPLSLYLSLHIKKPGWHPFFLFFSFLFFSFLFFLSFFFFGLAEREQAASCDIPTHPVRAVCQARPGGAAAGRWHRGPGDEAGNADAALPEGVLAAAERGVCRMVQGAARRTSSARASKYAVRNSKERERVSVCVCV